MTEEIIPDKPKVTLIKHSEEPAAVKPAEGEAKEPLRKKVVIVKRVRGVVPKAVPAPQPALASASDKAPLTPPSEAPLPKNRAAAPSAADIAVGESASAQAAADSEAAENRAAPASGSADAASAAAESASPSVPASDTPASAAAASAGVVSPSAEVLPKRRNYADNISQSMDFDQRRLESQKGRQNADSPRPSRSFYVAKNTEGGSDRSRYDSYGSRSSAYSRFGSFSSRTGSTFPSDANRRDGAVSDRRYPSNPAFRSRSPQGAVGRFPGGAPGRFSQGSMGTAGRYNQGQGFNRYGGVAGRPMTPGTHRPFGSPVGRRGDSMAPSLDSLREEGQKHRNKRFFKSKKPEFESGESKEMDFQLEKKKDYSKATPVPKEIDILEVISVSELARKMNLKAADLIGKLFSMGVMATINQQIDADTAVILADEYGCKVNVVSLYDETLIETEADSEADLSPRAPIVTVMGHVDHGKTKLLDCIRKSHVGESEAGGITQHIGAYKINRHGQDLVFLDTPGHSAFTLMRARGAQVTDIVVLVVAANDGVMPQTIEAIHHAQDAHVPIIVAVNKCDLHDANPDRVKQQLSEYGLLAEDWGGTTLFCQISALKGEGIDELLDAILLQAEMLELKANDHTRAEGKILESRVEQGRGIVSSVIIQRGTLKVGDFYVAGVYYGKVRALYNDQGKKIKEAGPSTPVEIIGLTGIPDAGAPFQVTENEKEAKQVSEKRQELDKLSEAKNIKKITLDNLYDKMHDDDIQELKVIVKGDVHGSVEAIQSALEKIKTDEIRINVIHASAGAIVESDVNLAAASNAVIIGFHVRPTPKAQEIAEKEKVEIRKYQIIYDVIEEMKAALEGLLKPDYVEEQMARVEVRETFKVPKVGTIAGCYVAEGTVSRHAKVHVIREGIEIATADIASLKRFKDDVKEVKEGYECGIGLESVNDVAVGDIYEVFEMKEVRKKLEIPDL